MNATKRYLKQVRHIDEEIEFRRGELEKIREDITSIKGIAYDKDRVQSSPTDDGILKKVIQLQKIGKNISDLIVKRTKIRNQIINEITMMPNRVHMNVLHKYYVDGKTFELIAVEMGYSYDRIIHIHSEALQAFKEKYRIR